MSTSTSAQRHADWIGMLQPDGLVVSVPVLEELKGLGTTGPSESLNVATATVDPKRPARQAARAPWAG